MYNFRKTLTPVPGVYQLCFKRYAHRNYYDSLEISPKSSKAEIKQAYYKLSMKYHPDKTEGNDVKFREITAAYEVLGNPKLRRLYDQGVINIATRNPTADELAKAKPPATDEEQSRFYRSKVPTTGRTQFYDYDEWAAFVARIYCNHFTGKSKAHYQKTLNREFEKKRERMIRNNTKQSRRDEYFTDRFLKLLLSLIVGATFYGMATGSTDIDRPSSRRRDK